MTTPGKVVFLLIDDKLRILSAMKKSWGNRLTTLWCRQGHYALDAKSRSAYPPADLSVERIADLVHCDFTKVGQTTLTIGEDAGLHPGSPYALPGVQTAGKE
jgi:hypothetical protein